MYRREPWMDDRIASLESGRNPTLILRMKSGFAVLGDYQYPPGYCVLLGYPRAESLNGLSLARRAQFMLDMTLIGDAVIGACKPAKINYAVMMNLDAYLHAHIQARYAWEPDAYRTGPAWNYPPERLYDDRYFCTGEAYQALQNDIRAALQARLADVGYWEDGEPCP